VGEKVVRKCPMLEGVTIAEGSKDELVISGNDIENVSQSAASITDKCRVKEKDVCSHIDQTVLLTVLTDAFAPRLLDPKVFGRNLHLGAWDCRQGHPLERAFLYLTSEISFIARYE
jgi:hypothetical protein